MSMAAVDYIWIRMEIAPFIRKNRIYIP